MPNTYFFAYGSDVIPIVEAAFEIEGCRVFEAYSAPESNLNEFCSAESLNEFLNAEAQDAAFKPSCHLAVWPSAANSKVPIETFALDPKACRGKTWRQRLTGWGVIFLLSSGVQKGTLGCSSLGVNSEARALGWEATYHSQMGPVAAWNWRLVAKTHRRLSYVINRKLAVEKVEGRAVLPEASRLLREGTIRGFTA